MKKLLYIIPLLCMALVSCGGDDDNSSSSGSDSGNKNQNSTSKSIYATRLEVPKVMNGNNYLLLTRLGDGKVDVNYMESRNNYRLPNYHRLDASVNFHRNFKKGSRNFKD